MLQALAIYMWSQERGSSQIQSMPCQIVVHWKHFSYQSPVLLTKIIFISILYHLLFAFMLQGEALNFGCLLKVNMVLSALKNYHLAIFLIMWILKFTKRLEHQQSQILPHHILKQSRERALVFILLPLCRAIIKTQKMVSHIFKQLMDILLFLLHTQSRLFFGFMVTDGYSHAKINFSVLGSYFCPAIIVSVLAMFGTEFKTF